MKMLNFFDRKCVQTDGKVYKRNNVIKDKMGRKSIFVVFGILFLLSFVSAGNVVFQDGNIYSDDNFLKAEDEDSLNVNSSNWWSGLVGWIGDWFVKEGNSLSFNEAKLNDTIDSRFVGPWELNVSDVGLTGNYSVGIGRNPEYSLDVLGDRIRLYNESSAILELSSPFGRGVQSFILNASSAKLMFNEGLTSFLTLDAFTTNVGIGTTFPSEKLEVIGSIKSQGFSVGNDTGLTGNYSVGDCWFRYNSGIMVETGC